MTIKMINAYLNFNGDAEKAIKLYERALGAQVEGEIMRFGGVPGTDFPPEIRNHVTHAFLRIGEGTIMISDAMPGHPVPKQGNVHVCVEVDNVPELEKKFAALAVGGQVTMPLEDTFWGARFGVLIDAHAICWMFNCTTKKT